MGIYRADESLDTSAVWGFLWVLSNMMTSAIPPHTIKPNNPFSMISSIIILLSKKYYFMFSLEQKDSPYLYGEPYFFIASSVFSNQWSSFFQHLCQTDLKNYYFINQLVIILIANMVGYNVSTTQNGDNICQFLSQKLAPTDGVASGGKIGAKKMAGIWWIL